jgi:uncharacterized membrane protein YccC
MRIIGTIVGVAIASVITAYINNPMLLLSFLFAFVAMQLAVSRVNQILRATMLMTVVLVLLNILTPDQTLLAQTRILDTVIGIGLALALVFLLWSFSHWIPLDAAAYSIAEDIRYYRQLGGLKLERNKVTQQIYILDAFAANKQQAIMALFRLQSMGINEDQILNTELCSTGVCEHNIKKELVLLLLDLCEDMQCHPFPLLVKFGHSC